MGGKILGVDYGLKRAGLAISDETGTIAFPFETVEFVGRRNLFLHIRRIVEEQEISELVVGLPLTLRGKQGKIAEEVKKFGEEIEKKIGVKVHYVDERFTSVEAEKMLRSNKSRIRRKDRRKIDLISAVIILQTYLDTNRK